MSKNLAPAPIVLFGSGETLPPSGRAHEYIASQLGMQQKIAILETPAGFEPNSVRVAGNVGDFLIRRLQNYSPTYTLIPARKKGTEFSPDNEAILAPLLTADWVFMGPGSPTYAVRQLQDSAALRYLSAIHRLGTPLTLASAAILAMSAFTLPVYEIYKVGEELHWKAGLNFLKPYGLELIFIPHWNNSDGGAELDTSRCYMGVNRFGNLLSLLPADHTLVGIDEHTALVIDFHKDECVVLGVGTATITKGEQVHVFENGEHFPLNLLGQYVIPEPGDMIAAQLAMQIKEAKKPVPEAVQPLSSEIELLVKEREAARARKDWSSADDLREKIQNAGWVIQDTPEGVKISPGTQE